MYKKLLHILIFVFSSTFSFAQVVNNATELTNAINAATPGTTIILADGTWNNIFIDINKNGTAAAPIEVTAQNPGAVFMTGNSRVLMEGSYLTVSGLIFENPSNLVVSGNRIEPVFELDNCDYCKILNNKIDSYNGTEAQKTLIFKWILADGENNEIAYNSFIGKYGLGSIINDNRNSTAPDYLQIHHNYFADRTPINGVNDDNDQDAIRIGNSSTSLNDSYTEVYDNYFYNFFGEIEIISNKSGQNKYYNNTFRDYAGCLTLRHGNNCEVYGNYFFAEDNFFSAGVRVIGEGHRVYNNYIEGINSLKPGGASSNATGGINVSNGRPNSALNGYYQVKNTEIINNTFVNCDYALRIGTNVSGDLTEEPENLTLANNIMYNTSVNPFQVITTPSGNYVDQGNLTNLAAGELGDDGSFYRITDTSTLIDAGIGTYTYLTHDVTGGSRDLSFDAGAEEFGSNGNFFPYDSSDVGVSIGFGAVMNSNPALSVGPSEVTYGNDAATFTFNVNASVDWTLTESLSWVSLDISTGGSGLTTITASITENTTGITRTGNIIVNEVAGGNNLTDTLFLTQLNTFLPREIPIVSTTSLGMQDKPEVSEINAYNDDLTNYWTGNPDTAAEVSITFDILCIQELTEIGINFWKADERTTTFSIAISNDSAGPFTTIINAASSAISTVETEQFFSLAGNSARYIKFIGIGNSSSTNWTSIANVNIYGDYDCVPSNTRAQATRDIGVTLFPVPTTNGILNINSKHKTLELIEIYNISGQKVLTKNANNKYTEKVDVSNLKSGIYFISLVGIGQLKFIIP